MYKLILLPIDMAQTEKGKAMIDVARNLGDEHTKIVLLSVVEDIPEWVAAELPRDVINNSWESAQDKLKSIGNAASTPVDVEVRKGHPYRTILETADEMAADLIIIASHTPGVQDYFLGSTAAKVVRHAKCSVLVVR